jgi:hypothetical protein
MGVGEMGILALRRTARACTCILIFVIVYMTFYLPFLA